MQLERAVLAADAVVFSHDGPDLLVLLHRRDQAPYPGRLALPGVAVQLDETLLQAAQRALTEKTGLAPGGEQPVHLEQLATFDALFRDPRGRTVSVAFLGLSRSLNCGPDGHWQPVAELAPGTLPFDHDSILATALERLRGKLRYTGIAAHLLPEPFRIEALRAVYEAVLGRRLNRSNFRSKLLKIGLIERVGVDTDKAQRRGGRPPHLYRFKQRGMAPQERDFL